MPESPHQVRFPIMSPPRPTTVHEVASASESGRRQRRNDDAVAVFALGLPQEELDIVVLAVADGLGEHARGTGTSAVAVEAFGDALGGLVGSLPIGPRWQFAVAEIVEAAVADTNAKIRALPRTNRGDPAATTLTAAVLLGNWLCAVHVGNSRVYRLSNNELEQLTEDHAREPKALLTPPRDDMLTINETGRLASALGVSDVATPSVLFRRIAPGDVVAVCSDGLHGQVGGEELARLLNASGPLDDIATGLVSAANAHGGDDNISVCLARVGKLTTRLPEPDERARQLYGDVAATILPRYQAEKTRQWLPDRIGLVAGFLVSLVALAGFVLWDQYKTVKAEKAGTTTVAVVDSAWSAAPATAPVVPAPPPVVPPVVAAAAPESIRTAPAAAEVVKAPDRVKPAPAAAVAESIAAATALTRAAEAKVRKVRDSLAEARMAEVEQQRRDSVALAVAAAARMAEQRARDSVTSAEKRKRDSIEAQERVEAQARAAQQAEEARQAQERQRETRLASGRAALNGWLQRVVSAVSNGQTGAAVMTAGPASFGEFVAKNSPKISDASVTSIEVDESSGAATAEWVLKWKSNFGTATQRRVKASATVVRDGETWRLLGWKILEGEP
ncbi:MAG: phosphoprotein phosphatase [Gemmatimonadetes bacterium]|nr:phosphoprotein phosphatase [Gemmatimonadota bacterium]